MKSGFQIALEPQPDLTSTSVQSTPLNGSDMAPHAYVTITSTLLRMDSAVLLLYGAPLVDAFEPALF